MAGRGWKRPSGGVCATLLAVVILQPLGANARSDKLQEAIAAFEQRGFVIRREHPRCAEPQLFGLYVRGRREVVVCPRGNQLETLLHEGWHAVQSLCLRGTPPTGQRCPTSPAGASGSPRAAAALSPRPMAPGGRGPPDGPRTPGSVPADPGSGLHRRPSRGAEGKLNPSPAGRELQLLYLPDQWPREAEARVMARERLDSYLQALDQACTAAVPAAPKAN